MDILAKVLCTLVLFLGMFWAFLPGQFGLLNFKKSHNAIASILATAFWFFLMLIHPIAVYKIWLAEVSMLWCLLILFFVHILFFTTVAKDVSTS